MMQLRIRLCVAFLYLLLYAISATRSVNHVLGFGTLWDDLGVAGPGSLNYPYTGLTGRGLSLASEFLTVSETTPYHG